MKKISRSAIVEHSAQRLYDLVEDIESYPQFLPWCLAASARRSGPETIATLTVGVGGLRQSFTTRNGNRPAESIAMQLVEGPFRSFAAAWRFRALSAAACKVEGHARRRAGNRRFKANGLRIRGWDDERVEALPGDALRPGPRRRPSQERAEEQQRTAAAHDAAIMDQPPALATATSAGRSTSSLIR